MHRRLIRRAPVPAISHRSLHEPSDAHTSEHVSQVIRQSSGLPLARDDSNGLNIVDIVRILQRHKKALVFPTLLLTALVFALLQFVSPRFTAQARLLIEGDTQAPTSMIPVSARLRTNDETIATSEKYIITSHDLLSTVIEELSLDKLSEFNPQISKPDTTDSVKLSDEQVRSMIVNELGKKIVIVNEDDTRVITIQATSNDPQLSASIANTIVEKYLEQQIELKLSTASRVDGWLVKRIEQLRSEVTKANDEIEAYKAQSELLQPGALTIITQEVSELSSLLLNARNDRILAESQIESRTPILDSSLISSLINAEASLKGEIAGLAGKYGPRHPSMIRMQAELANLQRDINNETNKVSSTVVDKVRITSQREAELESQLASMKLRLAEAKRQEQGLMELELESNASRELLTTFLARQKEVQLQNDQSVQRADARIISYAGIPHKQSFPNIPPITALAFVASLFLSIIAVFVIDQFNSGYKSVKQVTETTGLPILGVIPHQKKIDSVAQLVNNLKDTQMGESFRNLQFKLTSFESRNKLTTTGKTILVTSMYPNDGKTSVVSCLAMSLSRSGSRVLVIDGDLRKPSLHKIFGVSAESGIGSLNWANLKFDSLVKTAGSGKTNSGIDVISANVTGSQHPHDVLRSLIFTQILTHAKMHYDVVLVDSPPLRVVDDAVIISKVVDSTLFVIPWDGVSRQAVRSGLQLLNRDTVEGIVLTKMDSKIHDQQAYGDYKHYRKTLSEYSPTTV